MCVAHATHSVMQIPEDLVVCGSRRWGLFPSVAAWVRSHVQAPIFVWFRKKHPPIFPEIFPEWIGSDPLSIFVDLIQDKTVPIFMAGLGTGLAPFRVPWRKKDTKNTPLTFLTLTIGSVWNVHMSSPCFQKK